MLQSLHISASSLAMDYPAHAHFTEVKVTVILISLQHLIASPTLRIGVNVKVYLATLAATFKQIDSITLPHCFFFFLLWHLIWPLYSLTSRRGMAHLFWQFNWVLMNSLDACNAGERHLHPTLALAVRVFPSRRAWRIKHWLRRCGQFLWSVFTEIFHFVRNLSILVFRVSLWLVLFWIFFKKIIVLNHFPLINLIF